MRITREQAASNRKQVLAAATEQFREFGFDGVAVADLMSGAGMTHGGFYNHFASKADLEAEACGAAFTPALEVLGAVAASKAGPERKAALDRYTQHYLSAKARDVPGARCPMVAFASDVSRREPMVKKTFANGLRKYLDIFTSAVGNDSKKTAAKRRTDAIFRLGAMVGALSLARGVASADPELSDEILHAVRERLGGGPARK